MEHKIVCVEENSIGEELNIEAGDILVSINGTEIEDVFDFRTLAQDELILLLIRKPDGEEWEFEIEKEPFEELGLVFESDLMSDYRKCSNACIFCFIDQMPPGMRDTLYFKDDDSRLSFLQGNYITLTNMSEKEVERIIRYRLEPMNISVHTTDPVLRCKMLNNRFAGEKLNYIQHFYEAGLHMNMQIVLCKGWNDGDALHRTLTDLYAYLPMLESLSVVPVGLTRYREGLCPLESFNKEDALAVIREIETWQKKAYQEYGIHYVHASDEFYILAEKDFPEEERYDGYLQMENGVGMCRSFLEEAAAELEDISSIGQKKRISLATGLLSEALLKQVYESVLKKFPEADCKIYGITNEFFGPKITVSGLLTGKDLIRELKEKDLGDLLLLPNVMFRAGEDVMLDDITRRDLEKELKVPVGIVNGSGATFVRMLTGNLTKEDFDLSHGMYELSEWTN